MNTYDVYRCDKGRGGGVCIYVKEIYKVSHMKFDLDRPEGVEDIWLSVQCCKFPSVIVGCLYRHPKSLVCTYDYIIDVLKLVSLRNRTFYILGDFNDDLLGSNSKLQKVIENAKLTQLITKPTRITSNSATLLDVIVTNRPSSALQCDVFPCPLGDHELITVSVNLQRPRRLPTVKIIRDLSKYSPSMFCSLLRHERHNLNNIFISDNVDTQVKMFTDVFMECLNHCAPLVRKAVRRPPAPWINDNLRTIMKERNDTQRLLKNDRTNVYLSDKYKVLKKQVKKYLKEAKSEYYDNRFEEEKGNVAAMWDLLRQLVPKVKSKTNSALVVDELALKDKAHNFNNFSANVGENIYDESQKQAPDQESTSHNYDLDSLMCNSFRPQPTDSATIMLEIKHLKNTSSYGSDDIPLRFLRDSLPEMIQFLTCIFNTSIVTGTFPSLWKHAIVVPIFKAGDANEPKNYRPVSLLPIVSKVLERVIAKQLVKYLDGNHLLSNTQHGFRSLLSTETALLTLSNKLYENIDNRKISLLTLCDLSKAFDSVNHDILMSKLNKLRIDKFWFSNYLYKRSQSVRIKNCFSDKSEILYGVPQGSVLGPILFSIYVNDLSQHISGCLIIQYADDTQFLHTGSINNIDDLVRRAEETLAEAKKYFQINGLMLNSAKTQCMFVGSRGLTSQIPGDTCIRLDNCSIVPTNSVKNLGIYFDAHMAFDTHVSYISRKVFGTIVYINRIKDNFNCKTRITFIQSLVLRIMNYDIKIWGTANTTHMNQIQKLQNFAAKVALGGGARRWRDHATPYIRELGWLKMRQKYKYDLLVFIYNTIKGNVPSHVLSLPTVRDVRPLSTRQQLQLCVPRTNTCTGAKSILIEGPKLWNSLSAEVRCTEEISSFKKSMWQYLLNEQFNN